jgi:hypothetical protein
MEDKPKYEIPKYDPYTGELNPYHEEPTSEITAELESIIEKRLNKDE